MLALTTPQTVPNLTRIKAMSFTASESLFIVTLQIRPPPAGQDESTQSARAYNGTQTLNIRNSPDLCDTLAFSSDPTVNPFVNLLDRGQSAIANALDHCVTAISGQANTTQMLKALETSLSNDGIVPPGTVN